MIKRTEPARLGLLFTVLVIALAAILARTARAQGRGEGVVLLPLVAQARDAAPGCGVAGAGYTMLSIAGAPSTRPAAEHPDIDLAIRGWNVSGGALRLVDYGPTDDGRAPQLKAMFADGRLPRFSSGYLINSWDWECGCPRPPTEPWDVTLLGLATAPNEVIGTPDSGYDIGGGYDALVLYATPSRLTLKYTREDNVVYGYTIHLENVCVEPDLLALYNQADAAGRGNLPAVRGGQALGRAAGSEILVAIRDSGAFMDPRSRYDWWVGR